MALSLQDTQQISAPGEIITLVYSYYQPGSCWSGERLAAQISKNEEPPRLYCPSCRQHNTLKQVDADREAGEKDPVWLCKSCGCRSPRPKILRRKGGINFPATQVHKEQDMVIVDGMRAGRIMSAVERAGEPFTAWAMWAYTPEASLRHKQQIQGHVISALDESAFVKPKTLGESVRVVLLISLMLDERKNASRGIRGPSQMAAAIGVSPAQFSPGRRWCQIKTRVGELLQDVDDHLMTLVPRFL